MYFAKISPLLMTSGVSLASLGFASTISATNFAIIDRLQRYATSRHNQRQLIITTALTTATATSTKAVLFCCTLIASTHCSADLQVYVAAAITVPGVIGARIKGSIA